MRNKARKRRYIATHRDELNPSNRTSSQKPCIAANQKIARERSRLSLTRQVLMPADTPVSVRCTVPTARTLALRKVGQPVLSPGWRTRGGERIAKAKCGRVTLGRCSRRQPLRTPAMWREGGPESANNLN